MQLVLSQHDDIVERQGVDVGLQYYVFLTTWQTSHCKTTWVSEGSCRAILATLQDPPAVKHEWTAWTGCAAGDS